MAPLSLTIRKNRKKEPAPAWQFTLRLMYTSIFNVQRQEYQYNTLQYNYFGTSMTAWSIYNRTVQIQSRAVRWFLGRLA